VAFNIKTKSIESDPIDLQQLHEAGIPFIFDPGQGLPMFNGEDLMRFT
jgi:hypothetical protein